MKGKKELVLLYTRINGVEKVKSSRPSLEINKEFHESLGLKVGGAR